MRKWWLVPVIVALFGVVPVRAAPLADGLLTLEDVPDGWYTVDDVSTSINESDDACQPTGLPADIVLPDDAVAATGFAEGPFGPFIYQVLIATDLETAQAQLEASRAVAYPCVSETVLPDGNMQRMTWTALDVPLIGDDSTAVRIQGTAGIVAFETEIVMIRRGGHVIRVVHANTSFGGLVVDSALTEHVARAADDRLSQLESASLEHADPECSQP